MALKSLFMSALNTTPAPAKNEANGAAYAFSSEHALAQYAATGTFNQTFYATPNEQLGKVSELASRCDAEFVAKTAVYCREKGLMKDMPAFLAASLAVRDTRLLSLVFPRVIDSGKMLRNFVQIVRSGAVGRKSFGSAPKRLCRSWFSSRTPEQIFRQSLGAAPSMKDVIKMIRPSPKDHAGVPDVQREALYGYLVGKSVADNALPSLVREFESFKSTMGDVPDVPFEMLTALPLAPKHWAQLAKRMSFTQLRMNLNTLHRHGVFADPAMVELVASKLRDREQVRRAKVLPYQLLAAFRAAHDELPQPLTLALQEAMEIATENVPYVDGKVILCPDVSGSMQSAVTGIRKGATSAVRCIDVAALVSAAFLRRNNTAKVLSFSDDVVKMPRRLNPYDSVMSNAQYLASLPSGGTACSAPLRSLNEQRVTGDLVIYVSDNMSWADFARAPTRGATVMAMEWEYFRRRNPKAKLVLIDIQPYGSTQMHERADVLNVGGFSDSVFEVIARFAQSDLGPEHWVSEIKNVSLA
jgi:60 kDa SS-A/Ro ribonucleoprotein